MLSSMLRRGSRALPATASRVGGQTRSTTILSVRKGDQVFLIGDGQVSIGSQMVKSNARKVRTSPLPPPAPPRPDLDAALAHSLARTCSPKGSLTLDPLSFVQPTQVRTLKPGVVCGFAGATADAMTLFERLEMKLGEHPETMRACVEMAKAWRMDKYLRRLEAIMIVCDADVSLTLTGTGDVIEPEDGIIGIGSGGAFATAAARALIDVEGMEAEAIGRKVLIPFHTPPHPYPNP